MNKNLGLAGVALLAGLSTGCATTKPNAPEIEVNLQTVSEEVSQIHNKSPKESDLTSKESLGIIEVKTINDITYEELKNFIEKEIKYIKDQIQVTKNALKINKFPDLYKQEGTRSLTKKEITIAEDMILKGEKYIEELQLLLTEGISREAMITKISEEYTNESLVEMVNKIRENIVLEEWAIN